MSKGFWTYRADTPPEHPPPDFKGTAEEWRTLTPGYRRAIWIDFIRRENSVDGPVSS